jgi:hypothetical protein
MAAFTILLGLMISGCADEPELGNGTNTYTTITPEGRLRIMVVDNEMSRQAQVGSLDLNNLPLGKMVFREQSRVEGEDGTPWVVDTDFFFTQIDVYYAEVEPAGDVFDVVYQLHDEGGRNNSVKLQQVTVEMAAATGAADDPGKLAIINNETVSAVLPITVPITNGEIRVSGLSAEEAEEMTEEHPDRAFYFPEEGKKSRIDR